MYIETAIVRWVSLVDTCLNGKRYILEEKQTEDLPIPKHDEVAKTAL